jgi:hypothetical protein
MSPSTTHSYFLRSKTRLTRPPIQPLSKPPSLPSSKKTQPKSTNPKPHPKTTNPKPHPKAAIPKPHPKATNPKPHPKATNPKSLLKPSKPPTLKQSNSQLNPNPSHKSKLPRPINRPLPILPKSAHSSIKITTTNPQNQHIHSCCQAHDINLELAQRLDRIEQQHALELHLARSRHQETTQKLSEVMHQISQISKRQTQPPPLPPVVHPHPATPFSRPNNPPITNPNINHFHNSQKPNQLNSKPNPIQPIPSRQLNQPTQHETKPNINHFHNSQKPNQLNNKPKPNPIQPIPNQPQHNKPYYNNPNNSNPNLNKLNHNNSSLNNPNLTKPNRNNHTHISNTFGQQFNQTLHDIQRPIHSQLPDKSEQEQQYEKRFNAVIVHMPQSPITTDMAAISEVLQQWGGDISDITDVFRMPSRSQHDPIKIKLKSSHAKMLVMTRQFCSDLIANMGVEVDHHLTPYIRHDMTDRQRDVLRKANSVKQIVQKASGRRVVIRGVPGRDLKIAFHDQGQLTVIGDPFSEALWREYDVGRLLNSSESPIFA